MSLFGLLFGGNEAKAALAPLSKPHNVTGTTLSRAEISAIVNIVYSSIYTSGQNYVQQHYPSLWGMAASAVATLSHQAAINVVNDLVAKKKLP